MSRMLSGSELFYPSIEKEASAVIEATRKWSHLLASKPFTIVTDQNVVAYLFDNRKRPKIKNNKIQSWRIELGQFDYSIVYRPGPENVAPDALSRVSCATNSHDKSSLILIHEQMSHPGVTRLLHYIK